MITELKNIGFEIDNIIHLSCEEVITLCKDGAILVDIREEFETVARQFAVKNMILLPNSILKAHFNELPHNNLLIIADSVGLRSKAAVLFLKDQGFNLIANLAGGIVDWERAGYKVNKNPAEMLHGQCACMLKSNTGKKFDFKQ